MELHVLRSLTRDGKQRFWLLYDREHRLASRIGESMRGAVQRWTEAHGKPAKIIRYRGVARASKAAHRERESDRQSSPHSPVSFLYLFFSFDQPGGESIGLVLSFKTYGRLDSLDLTANRRCCKRTLHLQTPVVVHAIRHAERLALWIEVQIMHVNFSFIFVVVSTSQFDFHGPPSTLEG